MRVARYRTRKARYRCTITLTRRDIGCARHDTEAHYNTRKARYRTRKARYRCTIRRASRNIGRAGRDAGIQGARHTQEHCKTHARRDIGRARCDSGALQEGSDSQTSNVQIVKPQSFMYKTIYEGSLLPLRSPQDDGNILRRCGCGATIGSSPPPWTK